MPAGAPLSPPASYVPPAPPPSLPLTSVAVNPAAPLSPVQPSTNPVVNAVVGAAPSLITNGMTYGASAATTGNGLEALLINWVSIVVNIWTQYWKNKKWFHEKDWVVPLVFITSVVLALIVWGIFFEDIKRAVTNAFGVIANAHMNYESSKISGVGVFKPTKEENRWGAVAPTAVPSDLVIASR